MSAWPDPTVILLAAGVCALLLWFFWHVFATGLRTLRALSRLLDDRSARQRAALAGPVTRAAPFWLRTVRVGLIGLLVVLLAYQFAGKFEIR